MERNDVENLSTILCKSYNRAESIIFLSQKAALLLVKDRNKYEISDFLKKYTLQ